MQRVGGFGGKADQLNSYFVAGGGPDFFAEDLARYTSLSRVRRAGRGRSVAAGGSARGADGESGGEEVMRADGSRAQAPAHGLVGNGARCARRRSDRISDDVHPGTRRIARSRRRSGRRRSSRLPPIEKRTLVQRAAGVDRGGARGAARAGEPGDSRRQRRRPGQRQFGLASFTAAMLDEGAGTRSALEIADEVEFLGAEPEHDQQLRRLGGAAQRARPPAARRRWR